MLNTPMPGKRCSTSPNRIKQVTHKQEEIIVDEPENEQKKFTHGLI